METTKLLVISYIDNYLDRNGKVSTEWYYLIGMTAIIIAAKVNEPCIISVEQAVEECGELYPPEAFRSIEKHIL